MKNRGLWIPVWLVLVMVGCGKESKPLSAAKDVDQIVAMQVCEDGRYNVICDDGSREVISAADFRRNNVCPNTRNNEPTHIVSLQRRADGTFDVICDDSRHLHVTAEELLARDVCAPVPRPADAVYAFWRNTCVKRAGEPIACIGEERQSIDIPSHLRTAENFSFGWIHGCAEIDGEVECWGGHGYGSGPYEPMPSPNIVRASGLNAGLNHSCVLTPEGPHCWGGNRFDQSEIPPELENDADVKELAAGSRHTCAVSSADRVFCWGHNGRSSDGIAVPEAVQNLTPRQVTPGFAHTCAITDEGIICWGRNYEGATDVPALANATDLAAASNFTCAIAGSDVTCWGNAHPEVLQVPEEVHNPTSITAGLNHACVLNGDGRVICWGGNDAGQCDVDSL